jgi:hypothetical protein
MFVVDNEQGALLEWYWERMGNTKSTVNLSITHATQTGLGSSSEHHGDILEPNQVMAQETHHIIYVKLMHPSLGVSNFLILEG